MTLDPVGRSPTSKRPARWRTGPPDPLLPILAIPTTLSGAEFTEHAGVTGDDGVKRQIYHPAALPMAVILDATAVR